MKKSSGGVAFPSPKGWSSERVPHPTNNSSRRHITPFCSGRALPSKWEDAERWICSPVSGYSTTTTKASSLHAQFQRRPKSKSGPIVPQVLDGTSTVRNFMVGSPFSTGVLIPDGVCVNYGGGGQGYLLQNESNLAMSTGLPGWSDLASEDSLMSSQDDKLDESMDEETMASRTISRRDMATQMSPESSTSSSPRGKPFASPPSTVPVIESQNNHSTKLEIREVQIDNRGTKISRSRRHGSRIIKKGGPDVDDMYGNATGTSVSSWDLSEEVTRISKLQREEARIGAWEKLQKAKAEAAIRKLEMKLEKKRSYSMDKILNKLKVAQMKAQEMRSSISDRQEQDQQTHQKIRVRSRFFHMHIQMSSFRSCFACHAG